MRKSICVCLFFVMTYCSLGAEYQNAGSTIERKAGSLLIFSGRSCRSLAEEIAKNLDTPLGSAVVSTYNDGEINIQIQESVRNRDVFVIQSTCTTNKSSGNDAIMELFLMTRALKRSAAKSVTAIIPYYGYARQDRKSAPRVPISASDVAMMLESAGIDRVVSLDLHCGQIQGFFRHASVDNLYSSTIFAPYIAKLDLENPVVISPDAGGVIRAKKFKETLSRLGVNTTFGIIIKERAGAGQVSQMNLVGDVRGRDVIIVDDMCDTGGTLVRAAAELKAFGCNRVFACITHPVFSNDALEKIANSVFTEVVVTDTIPLRRKPPGNVRQLSVAPLLAEVIHRLNNNQSISEVFRLNPQRSG